MVVLQMRFNTKYQASNLLKAKGMEHTVR